VELTETGMEVVMAESDPTEATLTPTLVETARRRGELHATLVAVEEAIARPAAGREGAWAAFVDVALADLERSIDSHIEITEGPDGLYEDVAKVAPRLTSQLDRLRSEHERMLGQTRELRQRLLACAPSDATAVETIRDDAVALLGLLVRHRRLGSDLLWEAYSVDVGGIG